jgi:hypothetical protein
VKYWSIGFKAPCSMNCATTKESTFAQSGARPTLASSSRRACSWVVWSSGTISSSIFQSGCSSANFVKSLSKPSAQLCVVEFWWV